MSAEVKIPLCLWEQLGRQKKLTAPVVALGIDPGLNNCAYNMVKISSMKKREEDYEYVTSGKLESTRKLKGKVTQMLLRGVIVELNGLVEQYDPVVIAIERYSRRPEGYGDIEYLNLIIGAIVATSSRPVDIVLAAAWKPELLTKYKKGKKLQSKDWFPQARTDHEADAGCIALYSFMRLVCGFVK